MRRLLNADREGPMLGHLEPRKRRALTRPSGLAKRWRGTPAPRPTPAGTWSASRGAARTKAQILWSWQLLWGWQ